VSSGYVVPIDPNDFSRFVSYDPRFDDAFFDSEDDTLTEDEVSELEQEMLQLLDSANYESSIEPLLERIPAREADIIELYFLHRKRQADIATIFGITQAAVSYRLGRGIMRIKFLLDLPTVTREQMLQDLSEAFPGQQALPSELEEDPEADINVDVKILVNMWETTCQSEVAKTLGLTQGRVRHRFFKAVDRLRELAGENAKLEPYADIFVKISSQKKFNILREVKLPQWANRGGNEIL
jgi:DNA-directed RNA polymerase specialized sigma24 family protein